jgi:maltokinase-like protein
VPATLVPSFRDFLPAWLVRQPWFRGAGTASLELVGVVRFEDPDGQVGIETHLVSDGSAVYQIPMTYRGAPLAALPAEALIANPRHSELGPRWIYDGTADPVWRQQLLHLAQTSGATTPSGERGPGAARAYGHRLTPEQRPADTATIDLRRTVVAEHPAGRLDAIALVTATWQPVAPESPAATGCLAVIRPAAGQLPGEGR